MEYLRILHAAATTEASVVAVLAAVVDRVDGFDYVTVHTQVAPPLTVPVIHNSAPDLTVYDALRADFGASGRDTSWSRPPWSTRPIFDSSANDGWQSRAHFFAMATEMMRRILVTMPTPTSRTRSTPPWSWRQRW